MPNNPNIVDFTFLQAEFLFRDSERKSKVFLPSFGLDLHHFMHARNDLSN